MTLAFGSCPYLENLNLFSTLYKSVNKVLANKNCIDFFFLFFCGHTTPPVISTSLTSLCNTILVYQSSER